MDLKQELDWDWVCCGNKHATAFIRAFVAWCHLMDDIIDQDKPVSDERLIREEVELQLQLLTNPFFLQFKLNLWPIMLAGYNAWLDSNRWEQQTEDPQKAASADVIKGFYHEVAWACAFLCGGWDHLRAVTSRLRQYDHDYQPET